MANQQLQYPSIEPKGSHQTNFANSVSRPTTKTSKSSPSNILIAIIISIALALISLIIGIFSIILINQTGADLDSLRSEFTITEEEAGSYEDLLTCNLPSSLDDIRYLNITYNHGNEVYYVDTESIEYYSYDTTSAKSESFIGKTIQTDATDIVQYVFSNGLNDFSNYENDDTDWSWSAEIFTTDASSCLAKGTETPPSWLNFTINLINDKIKQSSSE
ncbi:MAG: hypothetical protein Q4F56_01680 [Candidatus Saccharibacteria bacterium]|nr:hypothetical protein [Candidatus Saccharibacteria bacterium]